MKLGRAACENIVDGDSSPVTDVGVVAVYSRLARPGTVVAWKAKQARTCQPCHNVVRGYGRGEAIRQLLAQPTPNERQVTAELGVASGELADLIRDQQRDDRARFVWDPHTVPLEAPNRAGRSLIDVIAA